MSIMVLIAYAASSGCGSLDSNRSKWENSNKNLINDLTAHRRDYIYLACIYIEKIGSPNAPRGPLSHSLDEYRKIGKERVEWLRKCDVSLLNNTALSYGEFKMISSPFLVPEAVVIKKDIKER